MSHEGHGYPTPAPEIAPWRDLFALPAWTGDDRGQALAVDWHLSGLSAPEPTHIPYAWLAPPLRFRQDKSVTYAAVSKASGGTAVATVPADEQIDFQATLDTGNDVDTTNLAHFMVTYYDEPRTRLAQVQLILNSRALDEIWTILGVGIGERILITDVPVGWPNGADNLVIEGIAAFDDGERRVVAWNTSPVIGEVTGSVGPFFRVGVSALGGIDKLPW